jgi:hypothetical protein
MLTISFSEGRIVMPYDYKTPKKRLQRRADPKPKTFLSLAWQILRAKERGQTSFSFVHQVENPILSIEGNMTECYLYRFQGTTAITANSGDFISVMKYVTLLAKNGIEEHRNALRTLNINVNVQST